MAQGILGFKYEEERHNTGMTGLAGLPVYLDLMHAMGLAGLIWGHLKVKARGWTDAQMVTALMMLNIAGGLNVDLYNLGNTGPLVGAGYIYENETTLAGHAFIFQGNVARQAADRLKEIGFTLLEGSGSSFRLTGKDEDTGRPIVVTIGENNDLTTVMTFEKGFYDRRVTR